MARPGAHGKGQYAQPPVFQALGAVRGVRLSPPHGRARYVRAHFHDVVVYNVRRWFRMSSLCLGHPQERVLPGKERIVTLGTSAIVLVAILCTTGAAVASPPVMEVDGEQFFPIGWYDARLFESAWDATVGYSWARDQGMNSVLFCYTNWQVSLRYTDNALAGALANDMKLMIEVNRNAVTELEGYPLSLVGDQVEFVKDHPALLGYYLMDEPEGHDVTAAMLQARYAQIRSHDADRPISVVHWSAGPGWRPAEEYLAAEPPPYTDIVMTDTYPVHDGTAEFSNRMWQIAIEARHTAQLVEAYGKQAYINVPQAASANGEWGLRSPTFGEQRYLSYTPIVHGARGLLYWMQAHVTPEYGDEVIGPIVNEIQSLVPAICSNSTAVSVSSSRDTDSTGHGIEDVSYLFGKDKFGTYLIAVNNTPGPISVTFELSGGPLGWDELGVDGVSAAVLFEGRSVLMEPSGNPGEWTLTDSFGPYDVNIYQPTTTGWARFGDLNEDGFVGQTDMDIVLAQWGRTAPLDDPRADASGDGFVGQIDLSTLLDHWGQGIPLARPAEASVPEPTTLGLLASCACALLWRRPKSR